MQVKEVIQYSDIDRTEAEILLGNLLQKNRAWILAHPEYVLDQKQQKILLQWITRRKKEEPIAYITGQKEFYGRTFDVDSRVLIPRPSTEGLISIALDMLAENSKFQAPNAKKIPNTKYQILDSEIIAITYTFPQKLEAKNCQLEAVVDIGTGSGCIAITLACEKPDLPIIATDISEDAIDVARKNAEKHGVIDRIDFRQGNLLDPVSDLTQPFFIVSNPPYIPDKENISPDVQKYEPRRALFGGADGTDVVQTLLHQAKHHPYCLGVVVECRNDQMQRKIDKLHITE